MAKTSLFRKYVFLDGKYKGKEIFCYYSDSDKKWETDVFGDKTIKHGLKGAKISPGNPKGQSYCSRSYGITDKTGNRAIYDPFSPNFLSRINWNCEKQFSVKGNIIKTEIGTLKITYS